MSAWDWITSNSGDSVQFTRKGTGNNSLTNILNSINKESPNSEQGIWGAVGGVDGTTPNSNSGTSNLSGAEIGALGIKADTPSTPAPGFNWGDFAAAAGKGGIGGLTTGPQGIIPGVVFGGVKNALSQFLSMMTPSEQSQALSLMESGVDVSGYLSQGYSLSDIGAIIAMGESGFGGYTGGGSNDGSSPGGVGASGGSMFGGLTGGFGDGE